MRRHDIVAAARAMVGTPFAHQGRVPGRGLDCAGLAVATARAVGVDVVDRADYGRHPTGALLAAQLDAQPALMRVTDGPQAGDILLMRFDGEPQHLAVCCGETIVHAYSRPGMVCEHRFAAVWRARVVATYRFRGIADE